MMMIKHILPYPINSWNIHQVRNHVGVNLFGNKKKQVFLTFRGHIRWSKYATFLYLKLCVANAFIQPDCIRNRYRWYI